MSLGLVTWALAQGSEISRPCPSLHSASGQRPNLGPPSPCLPLGPAGSRTVPSCCRRCCCCGVLGAGCVPATAGRRACRKPNRRLGRYRVYCAGPAGGQTATALRRFAGCDTAGRRSAPCSTSQCWSWLEFLPVLRASPSSFSRTFTEGSRGDLLGVEVGEALSM